MTTDDLARLRSLAEAATGRDGWWLPERAFDECGFHPAYPPYIAALDPQTVLALLDAAALGLALRSMVKDIIDQHDHLDWGECAPDVLVHQLQNALALADKAGGA